MAPGRSNELMGFDRRTGHRIAGSATPAAISSRRLPLLRAGAPLRNPLRLSAYRQARFEVLLPLQFHDGRDVPPEWLAEAVFETVEHFDAVSYETQKVEGHWRHGGVLYKDNLVKIVVDVKDLGRSPLV